MKHKKENKTETKEDPKHLVCGYCPRFIFQSDEPNAQYRYLDELPICARCRILKGSKASEIIADKDRVVEDLKIKNDMRQKKADEVAVEVAIATQEETKTQMIKS